MITKIDWLSFSLFFRDGHEPTPHTIGQAISDRIQEFSPIAWEVIFSGHQFEQRKGRAPYSIGFGRGDGGVFIFCHPLFPHFLVEFTGKGCDAIKPSQQPLEFLSHIAPRLTRIDIASDMLCNTSPLDFVAQRDQKRFKSHSEFVSETGVTCYVGSRTSDRYARVYRYNSPHERSHLLRSEFVLKGQDAKATSQAILEHGLPACAVTLGASFGWTHIDWQPANVDGVEISTWRPERHAGKTMFWLNAAVAPALKKLIRETGFDAQDWLNSVIKSMDETDTN